MKKLLLLIAPLLLSGCLVYGTGETTGYVYAVDDGILWDKAWFKSNLESSDGDCYLIDNEQLKEDLRGIAGTTKVKLRYKRHLLTLSICPDGTGTDDEITGFEIMK